MAGGASHPSQRVRNLGQYELLLYNIAMNRGKQAGQRVRAPKPRCARAGFSLENHKLQSKVDQLEREKKQYIHRHKGDRHMFKMSVHMPDGSDNWTYGEKFRANGEYRDDPTAARVPMMNHKGKKKKERQPSLSGDDEKSKKKEQGPQKTVAELIALMNQSKASFLMSNRIAAGATTPSMPSNSRIDYTTTPPLATDKIEHPTSGCKQKEETNVNLRILLDNYEIFVPGHGLEKGYQGYQEDSSSLLEKDVDIDPTADQEARGLLCSKPFVYEKNETTREEEKTNYSNGTDDWSNRMFDHPVDVDRPFLRSQSAQSPRTESKMKPKFYSRANTCVRKSSFQETPPRLSIRRLVVKADDFTKKPREFFWRSPSKRIELQGESLCKFHQSGEGETHVDETAGHLLSQGGPRSPIERRYSESIGPTGGELQAIGNVIRSGLFSSPDLVGQVGHYDFQRDKTQRKKNTPGCDMSSDSPINQEKRGITVTTLRPKFPTVHYSRASRCSPTPRRANPRPGSSVEWPVSTATTERRYKGSNTTHVAPKASRTAMMVFGTSLQERKEKETREKMDNFFARLDTTKHQAERGHIPVPTRPNTAKLRAIERKLSKQEYKLKQEEKYRRAAPWPVQVWC